MAWQMIDDLTGAVVAESDAHRLTVALDGIEFEQYDVAATEGPTLLAQLGEHLSGTAAPLGAVAAAQIDVTGAQDKVRELQQQLDAMRHRGVVPCGPIDTSGRDPDAPVDEVPLGRRIHEGLRTLDLPYRVEVALRRLGYRLARAYDGAAAADNACPEDPDGLHFATCGCDDVDPLNPNGDGDIDSYAESLAKRTVRVDDEDPVDDDVPESDPDGYRAGDQGPDVATPAAAARDQVGEAEKGRPTSAQLRAWAFSYGLPVSTTGGIKKWVSLAYERVGGGPPDDRAWRDGAADGGSWTRPDGTVVLRQGAPHAPETSPSARPGDEEPPASDPFPPADRASADPSPTADEPSTSDAVEGDPSPGSPSPGRETGTAATETPEPAGRSFEEAPASGQASPGRTPAAADDDDFTRRARAEELLSDRRTPRQVADQLGMSLGEVRAISADMRSQR